MEIKIQQQNQTISLYYTEKTLLSTAIRESGLRLDMPCNGKGICGKCLVYAQGALSPPTENEQRFLQEQPSGMRLACLSYAIGDCAITLPARKTEIVEKGELPAYRLHPMGEGYGFGVDIGTTTVVVYLYELQTGRKVDQASFANPQSVFGGDVISRIQESLNGNGEKLRELISGKLREIFSQLCARDQVREQAVSCAVITGNTTMLYLLCGQEVEPLSHAPFAISEYYGRTLAPEQIGMSWPGLQVYLPATMSAFVGSDITCALLSSRICQGEKPRLLVDIGTNGEMGIAHAGKLACCSTAAGPAFEGAGITMGTPAVQGAIDRVFVKDGALCYTTIQQAAATGICGSGLIDAVAALVETGLIDETGYIDEESELAARYVTEYRGEPAVAIGDSGVVLTQKDIRAVQLAKSAICAGIYSLIHQCGLTVPEIDSLLLAGGFGSYIDCRSAGIIGLIPRELAAKTRSIGNAAGMGAILLLLSQEEREESVRLAKSAEVLELSTSSYFMDKYVECMLFDGE